MEPAAYLCAHPGPVSPLPPDIALEMKLTEVSDLAVARRRVADVARILGLAVADIRMAEVAAGEVIANTFRHGIMPGQVRVWGGDGAVSRPGRLQWPRGGRRDRRFPAPRIWPGTAGAGLWVARQLANVVNVEIRSDATIVELQFPLSVRAAPRQTGLD